MRRIQYLLLSTLDARDLGKRRAREASR